MSAANIEVKRAGGGGWRWRIIADCGRELVRGGIYACDLAAMAAAKQWRAAWQQMAALRDGGAE